MKTFSSNGVFVGERAPNGSRNPLTVEGHWDWRNPLNILPYAVILIVLGALVSLVI